MLLLIFMLTAPLMHRGIDVNLPKSAGQAHRGRGAAGADADQGADRLPERQAGGPGRASSRRLRDPFKNRPDKTLYLKADQALQYGFVVETMDRIRRAGVEKLGMVTEPTRDSMSSTVARPAISHAAPLLDPARPPGPRAARAGGCRWPPSPSPPSATSWCSAALVAARDVGRLARPEDPRREPRADGGRRRHAEPAPRRADPAAAPRPAGRRPAPEAHATRAARRAKPEPREAASLPEAVAARARAAAAAAGRAAAPGREGAAAAGAPAERRPTAPVTAKPAETPAEARPAPPAPAGRRRAR